MKKLGFLILVILFFAGNAAATSLWKVSRDGSATYLGGTCHMLRKSDYPLPAPFATAYADSSTLIFEADPGQLSDPAMQQALFSRAVYTDGKTLSQVLQPETYGRLRDFCHGAGLPLADLERLKPPMLALTLLSYELQRSGVDQGGVDLHFYQKALADGKRIAALETMEQQVDFILTLGKGNEDRFMQYSLADLEKLEEVLDGMIAAWREGDEAAMAALVEAGSKNEFPEVYRTLFTERNAAWLPEIEKYLQTPETELVLVGVGHLVGEDGLIAALRQRGYEVRKME